MGYKIYTIIDHKVLKFFKTHIYLLPCQQQWIDYMLRYQLKYIVEDVGRYVQIDRYIDLEGEDLLIQ